MFSGQGGASGGYFVDIKQIVKETMQQNHDIVHLLLLEAPVADIVRSFSFHFMKTLRQLWILLLFLLQNQPNAGGEDYAHTFICFRENTKTITTLVLAFLRKIEYVALLVMFV